MRCSNCGTPLPRVARFCLNCGAAQTRTDAARDETDGAASPASGAAFDPRICETGVWRGYVKAEFVATVRDGDQVYEAARSLSFRCGRDGPSENDPRAVRAFEALIELLQGHGWEPVSGGQPWYAYRFRRRLHDIGERPEGAPPVTPTSHAPGKREGGG
jgi:zinc-ribbon domain